MALFRKLPTPPAPVLRPATHPRGLAGEVSAAAAQTSDALTRAQLNALVPRIARIERSFDEMCAEALQEMATAARMQ